MSSAAKGGRMLGAHAALRRQPLLVWGPQEAPVQFPIPVLTCLSLRHTEGLALGQTEAARVSPFSAGQRAELFPPSLEGLPNPQEIVYSCWLDTSRCSDEVSHGSTHLTFSKDLKKDKINQQLCTG